MENHKAVIYVHGNASLDHFHDIIRFVVEYLFYKTKVTTQIYFGSRVLSYWPWFVCNINYVFDCLLCVVLFSSISNLTHDFWGFIIWMHIAFLRNIDVQRNMRNSCTNPSFILPLVGFYFSCNIFTVNIKVWTMFCLV